ncbi:bile acid:sodium symporter family protein [Hydrocarboniclastica marina]|uniref:Bile acid:sodium symporter family protein n=1 Tax=Hydrocarboniclastica marina TaxID=2259620 RepID=A0A4V1D8X7_9ALTE|nr:bile acid:sodium symporter family protein [Hydrocarboniclastica marina]MAL97644.1 bile acid:sodium symporter [Alteromonadaceae bacterium]QCF26730.1 bile acid:sodium symporter family protein [Hydrocarboniclastica marina]|tara:strand:- start:2690 stop:3592 length:903 start_codon:yes stop_codon:yes gene_type:complete
MSGEELAGIIKVQVIPWSLFLIMLGMGLSLIPDDFRRVLKYPRAVVVGLGCQLLLLPIIGFALANLMPLSPELAVGVMLLAVCPGGTTSNLFAHLGRGDVALSVTLTAVASIITVFTIPFIVNASLLYFLGETSTLTLPVGRTILTLVLLTIVPISLGMLIRNWRPAFAIRAEPHVKRFAILVLAGLIALIIFQQRDVVIDHLIAAGPVSLVLNISTMAAGFVIARWLRLNRAQSLSVTFEVGLQNSSLAILLAVSLLQSYEMSTTPAIYSMVMFATAGLLVYWLNRKGDTPDATGSQAQ